MTGPDAPHVGWKQLGKRKDGAERGHIILDDVPANRDPVKARYVMSIRLSDEVRNAAATVGVSSVELAPQDGEQLRLSVWRKFADAEPAGWLWSNIKSECVSTTQPGAWRWVGDFVGQRSVLLFFNHFDDQTVFEFKSGREVVAVLEECYSFEFYLTDRQVSYLLCENHHDALFAAGEQAVKWLEEKKVSGLSNGGPTEGERGVGSD